MTIAETVLEKLNALPLEKQAEVLRFVETVSKPVAESQERRDPYAWLTVVGGLNLEGPSDWSQTVEEYLEGGEIGVGS